MKVKYREFKNSRDSPENSAQARKSFKATVKAAKKKYWRKRVEDATTDAQVFKVMQWAKPKLHQESPPLKILEERWTSDPLERAESLRDTLMSRFNATHDINIWEYGQEEVITWNTNLSLDDVR